MSDEHLKQLEAISKKNSEEDADDSQINFEEDADDSQIRPDGNSGEGVEKGSEETSEKDSEDGSMSVSSHLEELRSRIIKCLISVAICSVGTFSLVEEIMHYISKPAGKLYFMQPSEAFFTYLKVAVVAGFLISLPIIFYHVWRFFLPALTKNERGVLGIIVPISVILFFSGLAFSFFLVLPAGIRFFMGFGGEELEALLSVNKYVDFVIAFVLPFGFVFELPLIITILGKLGLLTSQFLQRYRKIVFFLSFVIGAIITPTPDVFTQSMIAIPMILLYEIGFLIVKYILRK